MDKQDKGENLKRINLTNWKPRRRFWACINRALENLDTNTVTLVFVDLEYVRKLKREIMGLEEGADVLTFVYDGIKEVLVCPEFLNFNEIEIARRIIHGVLHALGYDHKIKSKALIMEKLEEGALEVFKRCYNIGHGKV